VIARERGSAAAAAGPSAGTIRLPGVVFLGVLLPLGLFGALAAIAVGGGVRWDTDTLRFAERHFQASTVDAFDVALRGSLGLAMLVAVGAIVVSLIRRKPRYALLWAVAVGGVVALDVPLKQLFRRPDLGSSSGGYSFPSGHAMAFAAVLAAIAFTASRRWRRWALLVGIPLLVCYGVALVYAWWHYPTDVIAGWCLATAWTAGFWLVLVRYSPSPADRAGA
jgi:undecaprenyl-diphosphatase